jgi:hypothetical protein
MIYLAKDRERVEANSPMSNDVDASSSVSECSFIQLYVYFWSDMLTT